MKFVNISRVRFFNIVAAFPFVQDRLQSAGEIFITGYLTNHEAEEINKQFPGAVWE